MHLNPVLHQRLGAISVFNNAIQQARRKAEVTLDFDNGDYSSLVGQILTADAITAKNTFDAKEVVKPASFSSDLDELVLPAKSIVVAELK
tara:strand:- start:22 stop:291 length:270 start_codon:yes stop_codon:yes gene_type:complete